jgi:signal transduction histidine kinase
VAPELSTVVSVGGPAGLSLALAVAGERLRSSRRRAALNRALHELRRPLQALSLVSARLDGDGPAARTAVVTRESVDAALAALADLDREINRLPAQPSPRPVAVAAAVHAAVERWRGPAAARGRSLTLECELGDERIVGDARQIERALDNLIANSLEHGTLNVALRAAAAPRGVRISIGDGGPAAPDRRRRRDPRRGHGLQIVGRIARDHGGRFLLDRSSAGTEAVLELPAIAEPAHHGAREPAA